MHSYKIVEVQMSNFTPHETLAEARRPAVGVFRAVILGLILYGLAAWVWWL